MRELTIFLSNKLTTSDNKQTVNTDRKLVIVTHFIALLQWAKSIRYIYQNSGNDNSENILCERSTGTSKDSLQTVKFRFHNWA